MKLNKLLCVMIALLAINASAYAVEVSLGFSTGGGLPIMRGKDFADYTKNIDDVISDFGGNTTKMTLAFDSSIDVMVGFLPYLALETGLGFKNSLYGVFGTASQGLVKTTIDSISSRREIYIPVMLRGQYEYKIGVTYASVGVKLGFGLSDVYNTQTISVSIIGVGDAWKGTIKTSPVSLDVAFSLGQEFKVKKSHFLGLRFNYDLNVVAPYAVLEDGSTEQGTGKFPKGHDWAHDDFTVQFTYRYVFGRTE